MEICQYLQYVWSLGTQETKCKRNSKSFSDQFLPAQLICFCFFFPLQKDLARKARKIYRVGHSAQPTVCGFTYWLRSYKRRSNFSIVIRLPSHTAQEIDTNSISPCSCWNLEAQYELTQPFLAESSSDSPSLLCLSCNPNAEQFIINSTLWM